jgi:hypothetical protein
MMAKWLPTTEPSMIPEYANQYLGNLFNNVNIFLFYFEFDNIKNIFHAYKNILWLSG